MKIWLDSVKQVARVDASDTGKDMKKTRRGSKGTQSGKKGGAAASDARTGMSLSVGGVRAAARMGDLIFKSFNGEKGSEGVFLGTFACNAAATGMVTSFTPNSIIATLNGGLFAKCWNSTSTALYNRFRIVEVGITASPITASANLGSTSGAYALQSASSGGVPGVPSTMLDVLQLQESMQFLAPVRYSALGVAAASGFRVNGPSWCSRPSRTLTWRPTGTDIPWVDTVTGVSATTPVMQYVYYGEGTGSATGEAFMAVRIQFVGLTAV